MCSADIYTLTSWLTLEKWQLSQAIRFFRMCVGSALVGELDSQLPAKLNIVKNFRLILMPRFHVDDDEDGINDRQSVKEGPHVNTCCVYSRSLIHG